MIALERPLLRQALPAAALLLGGCNAPPQDTIRITIPRGMTVKAVAETLETRGVIRSAELLRFYSRTLGRQREIRAGTYDFPYPISTRRALEILLYGREAEVRFAVPEGLMLSELAQLVEERLGIARDSFLAAASDPVTLAEFGIPGRTAEGYLYPSTYFLPLETDAREVVRRMLSEFQARWRPEWDERLKALGLDRHQAVILASIIEGEVRYPPDRPWVSSVYHNRLRRGMRLQADPTVIYALGRRRRLFEKDYQFPSPYNTYLIDGLPPGPIGQPSAASIEAALNPAKSDFLYLVARSDGKHIFSRTLREHLEAVAAVRREAQQSGSGRE
ncbi:MAG: aminodeoxychorismate lyase [Gemmatimonadales bacterium]|nr:Endolytic murein transglycosylase [bacterium HR33]GIW51851.1 MAG: aminodeoxychorismate lyase [Gemmatimonadales bacterium]